MTGVQTCALPICNKGKNEEMYLSEGGNIVEAKDADVVVIVHDTDTVPDGFEGTIFDPWRNHTGDNVIRYGDTR